MDGSAQRPAQSQETWIFFAAPGSGSIWVEGIVPSHSHDIHTLESLPLVTTPTPPPTTPWEKVLAYNHLVETWETHEITAQAVSLFKSLDLHAKPQHPGMACPDMPGLAESHSSDPLNEEDLLDMAHTFRSHIKDISFIKGFVDSSHPMEGLSVQQLRESILADYQSTVFSGQLTGSPPSEAPLVKLKLCFNPTQYLWCKEHTP